MSDLLIHADPGGRAHFVAAWLKDKLAGANFEVGASTQVDFVKIHMLDDPNKIKNFVGHRIRINTTFEKLDLQLLLFLRKNVHVQIPDFDRNEFGIKTFSKVYQFAKDCLHCQKTLDYTLYDHVIDFSDTFNIEALQDLYSAVNCRAPDSLHVDRARHINLLNLLEIDPNHACRIAAMVLQQETSLGLREKDRLWNLPAIYDSTPTHDLYNTIFGHICAKHYQNLD